MKWIFHLSSGYTRLWRYHSCVSGILPILYWKIWFENLMNTKRLDYIFAMFNSLTRCVCCWNCFFFLGLNWNRISVWLTNQLATFHQQNLRIETYLYMEATCEWCDIAIYQTNLSISLISIYLMLFSHWRMTANHCRHRHTQKQKMELVTKVKVEGLKANDALVSHWNRNVVIFLLHVISFCSIFRAQIHKGLKVWEIDMSNYFFLYEIMKENGEWFTDSDNSVLLNEYNETQSLRTKKKSLCGRKKCIKLCSNWIGNPIGCNKNTNLSSKAKDS